MRFVSTDLADGGEVLDAALVQAEADRGTGGNRLYYLAVPPSAIGGIVQATGSRREGRRGWTRVVVEKPFGHDLASARELQRTISEHFAEDEVFRIDHYLGKETVQNMLALRFANGIFEPIWNRQYIDHVADHRRRVDRDRGAGRPSTSRPARSATSSRTTSSSSSR